MLDSAWQCMAVHDVSLGIPGWRRSTSLRHRSSLSLPSTARTGSTRPYAVIFVTCVMPNPDDGTVSRTFPCATLASRSASVRRWGRMVATRLASSASTALRRWSRCVRGWSWGMGARGGVCRRPGQADASRCLQFVVCSPHDDTSWQLMDEMLTNAEDFLKGVSV